MAEIALISDELFYENSPVKEETTISKFIPYVLIAQKIHITRILGEPLTVELQEAIKADKLSPEQSALIRTIAPALSFWAVYQALPFHWAAIVNKGVTLRESENSKAVSTEDIAAMRRWLRDDAQTLTRNIVDYLTKCAASFPAWRPAEPCGCGEDGNEGSNRSEYNAGIYIPEW